MNGNSTISTNLGIRTVFRIYVSFVILLIILFSFAILWILECVSMLCVWAFWGFLLSFFCNICGFQIYIFTFAVFASMVVLFGGCVHCYIYICMYISKIFQISTVRKLNGNKRKTFNTYPGHLFSLFLLCCVVVASFTLAYVFALITLLKMEDEIHCRLTMLRTMGEFKFTIAHILNVNSKFKLQRKYSTPNEREPEIGREYGK